MKAFYAVLVLFGIMAGGACFNYFYIRDLVDDYIDILEPLDVGAAQEEAHEAALRMGRHWKDNREYVQITVPHNEVEAITNAIDELTVYARLGSVMEFEKAKDLLINALEELWLSEDLSPSNIL